MFTISLVIAGVLMASTKRGGQMAKNLFLRLVGEHGAEFAEISIKTVRGVVKEIIGLSLFQSILPGLGGAAVGIPGAGQWAFLCCCLAIIQIAIRLTFSSKLQ